MDTKNPAADAVEILDQLDPNQIRHEIDQLDRRRNALMVLLRAARRAKVPLTLADQLAAQTKGADHA